MCGIAGIVGNAVGGDVRAAISRMTAAEGHRGPDADGFYSDAQSAFGHRRLAVIDLNESANQPMADASDRFVLTFNGEIYNFRELRAELTRYPFRTSSDTETILAAFAEWGDRAVDRLKGQFAFSIWDKRESKLFVARDRLGEKPFYYYCRDGLFVFASELRSLLASGFVPRQISTDGLVDYLVNESVHAPSTILKDVHQLRPGHCGWVSQGRLETRMYWSPVANRRTAVTGDYKSVCRDVRQLLDRAIDGQMVSDVPIGAFLSGGIDSSAIVALMAERSHDRVNTLSVTFEEAQFDEGRFSSLIAERFRTQHHPVRLKADALLDVLPDYFASVDSPSVDGPNTYIVSKAAKAGGLTVVLSGVGGDELFAGYGTFDRYRSFRRHDYLWRSPRAWRRGAARAILGVAPSHRARKLATLLNLEHGDVASFYETNRSVFSRCEIADLLAAGADLVPARAPAGVTAENGFGELPLLSQMSVLELANYMQAVLLKDTDNMSMAASLEVRLPLCDHELIEYVLAVPDGFKMGRRPKQLLVDSLGGLLPDQIVERPKMGFTFPWGRWIRNELHAFCRDQIRDLSQRSLFNESSVLSVWTCFNAQRGNTGWSQVWELVALEQWLKRIVG